MMPQNISDPMQREAVRRMQELHGRATKRLPERQPENKENERDEAPKENVGKELDGSLIGGGDIEPKPPQGEKPFSPGAFPAELKNLLEDRDQGLILILIILLMGEQSDTSLLMALVYLIL